MLTRSSAPAINHPAAPALARVITYATFFMIPALIIGALLLPFKYRISIILGLVQGLGEFLPISSSAHLILTPWFLNWPDPGLTFNVALHIGTLAAVAVYFWRDWLRLLRAAPYPRSQDGRLFWLLMLGAIPGGVVGMFLDSLAEEALRNPLLIAGTLSVMGVGLFAADRWGGQNRGMHDIGIVDALIIGFGQALALVPGVSRSGITIALARARGIERAAAARFSFLLGSPIILGAALFKLRHLADTPGAVDGPFIAGIATAAVVGMLSIGFLLRYLQRAGLGIFVIYRLLLALLIVATLLVGLR